MKKNPLVSVGMPIYNGAEFIRDALDSLLAQTFTDFEIIISDNASNDETESICREYLAKNNMIRYFRQTENKGPFANFKFVLEQATGEYFMWAAHDDRHHPDFLRLTVWPLQTEVEIGLVFTGVVSSNLISGETLYLGAPGFTRSNRKLLKYIFRLSNESPHMIYGLHRREVLSRIKLTDFDYSDIYISHWYELNSKILTIPLPLFISGITKTSRMPYSLTGEKITIGGYLKAEWILLRSHLNILQSIACFTLCTFLMIKGLRELKRFHKIS